MWWVVILYNQSMSQQHTQSKRAGSESTSVSRALKQISNSFCVITTFNGYEQDLLQRFPAAFTSSRRSVFPLLAGIDATEAFLERFHTEKAYEMRPQYCLGRVEVRVHIARHEARLPAEKQAGKCTQIKVLRSENAQNRFSRQRFYIHPKVMFTGHLQLLKIAPRAPSSNDPPLFEQNERLDCVFRLDSTQRLS